MYDLAVRQRDSSDANTPHSTLNKQFFLEPSDRLISSLHCCDSVCEQRNLCVMSYSVTFDEVERVQINRDSQNSP